MDLRVYFLLFPSAFKKDLRRNVDNKKSHMHFLFYFSLGCSGEALFPLFPSCPGPPWTSFSYLRADLDTVFASQGRPGYGFRDPGPTRTPFSWPMANWTPLSCTKADLGSVFMSQGRPGHRFRGPGPTWTPFSCPKADLGSVFMSRAARDTVFVPRAHLDTIFVARTDLDTVYKTNTHTTS